MTVYTKSDLLKQLAEMGIVRTDTITIHSSLRAIGPTEDGARGLIEALRESVADGLLLIPAHTYKNINETPLYDVRETLPCIGTLPKVAVELANEAADSGDTTVRRSLHPSHSVVAFGARAREFVAGDAYVTTAMSSEGCYARLRVERAKILLAGVDLTKNTFFHYLDEIMRGSYKTRDRHVTVVDYDGNRTERNVLDTYGRSSFYERYHSILDEACALTYGRLGDAQVIICDAAKAFDAILSAPILQYD